MSANPPTKRQQPPNDFLNGLLLVDKTTGGTSHDVVAQARRILGTKAVGHCGTLDPLASGLLVLLIGQATKLSDYILGQDKRYRVQIKLGLTTNSGDRTGVVVEEKPVDIPPEKIFETLHSCLGEMQLPVPIFSAIKVKGQKLYEYARDEKPVAIPIKDMKFFDLSGIEIQGDMVTAEVSCSKGGYIRSWVTEIGTRLGVGATVSELRRLESAPYHVHNAVTLDELQTLVKDETLPERLELSYIPIAQALPGWRSLSVRGREEVLLMNGQISHDLTNRLIIEQKDANSRQLPVGIKVIGEDGDLLGLLEAWPAKGLKIRRIFKSRGS